MKNSVYLGLLKDADPEVRKIIVNEFEKYSKKDISDMSGKEIASVIMSLQLAEFENKKDKVSVKLSNQ